MASLGTSIFFKHSSARRKDFLLIELITESVETDFMLRHVSSRWLSLKRVLNRILEQWQNLREYFLEFLAKEINFRKYIGNTDRYQRIRNVLTSQTSQLYMTFAVYVANCLENSIIPFQCSKPIIHVLYPAIGDLLFILMGNFVKSKVLMTSNKIRKDAHELGTIDIKKIKILFSIHKMDFGSMVSYQIGLLETKINLDVIKMEFKIAYIELTSYLQALPHENPLLKNLEYIHPKKVREAKALTAIGELAATLANTLKGSKFTALNPDR